MYRHILLKLSLLFCCIYIFSSCRTVNRLAYFQKGPGQSDTLTLPQPYISKINTGDILAITVTSLNSGASEFFNPYTASAAGANSAGPIGTSVSPGFLVNEEGTIE